MVEWKKLGDVAFFYRGVTYNKNQEVALNSGGIKILRANNITLETNSLNYDDIKEINPSVKIRDNQWLYPNDILICAGSGSKEHVGKVAFVNETIGYAYGGFMGKIVTKGILNPRYLFHILCGSLFKDYLKVALNSTTINNLNSVIINNFQLPLPIIAEQQHIVKQLDTFTVSIDNLKEQIAQRRKQYEYYRDQLLDLEGKEGVEMKKLGDVCDIKGRIGFRGYTREDQVDKGEGALTLTATNIVNQHIDYQNNTYITWEKYYESPEIMVNEGDIIVCQRVSIGKIAIIEYLQEKATINPQLLLLKNIKCNNRFLIHYLLSKYFQDSLNKIIGHGTVQMIAQKDLKELKIPLIMEEEQSRIVSILDTFEASIQNLEAQLSQREKQYEYYRNKLLTFE